MSSQKRAREPRYFRLERCDVVAQRSFLRYPGRDDQIQSSGQLGMKHAKGFACQTFDPIALDSTPHAGPDGESKP